MQDVPSKITEAGVGDWYAALNDPNKVKVKRYLDDADASSPVAFLVKLMGRASEDHNYGLSVTAGEYALSMELSDIDRFTVTEAYIAGLFGLDRTEDVKKACCDNLDLFPSVKDEILARNGGSLPTEILCRNRLIDVMVGADSDYDGAMEALDAFVELGLMDEGELPYRKQSLKIHRLQKSFDNLFNYRPSQ